MWVTRHSGPGDYGFLSVWCTKPRRHINGSWFGGAWVFTLRNNKHGLCLKPGECVEIEDIKLVRKAKPKRRAKR